MTKTGYYEFIGFKNNGSICAYKIYEYDEIDPKYQKKFETLQRKIINTISNKKKFEKWCCNYYSISDNIKESEAIKCRM